MNTKQYSLPYISTGLSKSDIAVCASEAVNSVLEQGNVYQVAETLSAMDEFIKTVKKDPRYIDYVREELAKNNGKFTTPSGAKIEAMEAGTKYDYSQCNDTELERREHDLLAAQNRVKERQEFLKKLPARGITEILDGGEVVEIFPPSKTSTSTYKLTLKP